MSEPRHFDPHCQDYIKQNSGISGFCKNGFQQNYGCLHGAIKTCVHGQYLSPSPFCMRDEVKPIHIVDYRKVRAEQGND